MADCALIDIGCKVSELISNDAASTIGLSIGMSTSFWMATPTVKVTGTSGGMLAAPPGDMQTWASQLSWIALVIAVVALIVWTLIWLWSGGGQSGRQVAPKLMWIIGSAGVIGMLGSLLSAFFAGAGGRVSDVVAVVRDPTMGWAAGLIMISTIIGIIRILVAGGREAVSVGRSLLTMLAVTVFGATATQAAIDLSNTISFSLVMASSACTDTDCFAKGMTSIMVDTLGLGSIGLSMIIELVVVGSSLLQVVLMIGRNGILVLLVGLMPLSASLTTLRMGQQWFERVLGWLIAFILYKPIAALTYAAAFSLIGDFAPGSTDNEKLIKAATGMLMMVLAVLALPALLRVVVPATAALGSGGAAGAAAGAMAGVAVQGGSMVMYRSMAGGARGAAGETGSSPSGVPSAPGASGSQGTSGWSTSGSTGGPGGPGAGGPGGAGTGGPQGGNGSGQAGQPGQSGTAGQPGPQGTSVQGQPGPAGASGSSSSAASSSATGSQAGAGGGAAASAGGGGAAAALGPAAAVTVGAGMAVQTVTSGVRDLANGVGAGADQTTL